MENTAWKIVEGMPSLVRDSYQGMYANNGETGAIAPADFDWFRYQGLENSRNTVPAIDEEKEVT